MTAANWRLAWRCFSWAVLAVMALAAFTVPASYVSLWGQGALHDYADPWWRWWQYLLVLGDPDFPDCARWEGYGALAGLVLPVLGGGRLVWWYYGPAGAAHVATRGIVRGRTDNFGHADWMSDRLARKLFAVKPERSIGGLVVGVLARGDQGRPRDFLFNPRDPRTWQRAASAPLLWDHLWRRSTHGARIGGSGLGKTWALIAALLGWRSSAYVLDPSGEIGDRCGDDLRERGFEVVTLAEGGSGPNVLAGITKDMPGVGAQIDRIVGRLIGPPGKDQNATVFAEWGKEILRAITYHVIWDDDAFPPEHKNLLAVRRALEGGEQQVRNRLLHIAQSSPSPTARSLAGTWWDKVKETFDGAILNATRATAFLAEPGYASLVCDGAYGMADLGKGKLVVFCQVPEFVLDENPAVARVLFGCHADAVIRLDGQVHGRVWFAIDEAVLMRGDPAIKTLLNRGRKFRATMWLLYQDMSQIELAWGLAGVREFLGSMAWVAYQGVASVAQAKDLSDRIGPMTVRTRSVSSNRGTSGRGLDGSGSSRGSSASEQEGARALALPGELLNDLADNELLIVAPGLSVLRCMSCFPFMRPEMRDRIGESRQEMTENVLEAAE